MASAGAGEAAIREIVSLLLHEMFLGVDLEVLV